MASALREHVLQYIHLGGYSPKTVKSYIRAYEALARFYWKALDYLSCQQVQNYLDYLITEKILAMVNVNFSAYCLLYEKIPERSAREF